MSLPEVGSEDFRSLSWQEQISIVRTKLFDPDAYVSAIGGLNKQDQKLLDVLAKLRSDGARELPKIDGLPISIVLQWIALPIQLTKFVEKTLDDERLDHEFLISTAVLRTPVFVLPVADRDLMGLFEMTMPFHPCTFFTTKIYWDLCLHKLEQVPSKIRHDYLGQTILDAHRYFGYRTFEWLVQYYPLINQLNGQTGKLMSGSGIGPYVVLPSLRKKIYQIAYYPVLPVWVIELMYVRKWDFLI